MRRDLISNRQRRTKAPPHYDVHDDDFYHGPAWVIKPRLFQPKEDLAKTPGPGYYHIPERSIYTRPGQTIGNRYETPLPISTHLLAHYSPNDRYTSNNQTPVISITPRRMERTHLRGYSERLYYPLDQSSHSHVPLLRPLYGPTISRKSLGHNCSSSSPGPAAYPMYEFDEDLLPRPQPGVTQKHRFPSSRSTPRANPPFYYPKKADPHRLPSFTIGRRVHPPKKIHSSTTPYYSPSFNMQTLCSSVIKPGATLKGRWSPAVCIPKSSKQHG